jgi:EPS-associated MarR family transcriptional regulator|tara:strand:- start:104 stop:415 length:312 start_codon:yes stop_codon:yes gene_type:complete
MNKSRKNIKDQLDVMRKIGKNINLSQRDLAAELGFSLGKINYCLKELKVKGFIKMNNFKKSKNKIKYVYVLTPGGIAAKTKLTINFMKHKMKEYDELKKEISN